MKVSAKDNLKEEIKLMVNWNSFKKVSPEDVPIPDGVKLKENFPECCNQHTVIRDSIYGWFERFPNCCDEHKKLISSSEYKKENFDYVPEKLLYQIVYTYRHLINIIDSPDWLTEFFDYMSLCYMSYGKPNVGAKYYWSYIIDALKLSKDLPPKKKKILLKHIKAKQGGNKEDMRMLSDTYHRWLETFPFEISFFKNIKAEFENTLPIIKELSKKNPNSIWYSCTLLTQDELIKNLTNTTNIFLGKVNAAELVREGLIKDIDKEEYDTFLERERVKILTSTREYTKGELKYTKAIKNWLRATNKFFQKLKNRLEKQPKPAPVSPEGIELSQRQVALLYYYLSEADLHPRITAHNQNEVAAKHGYTSPTSGKQICQKFTDVSRNQNERIAHKNAVNDIGAVLEQLEPYPEAQEQAKVDLQKAIDK